MVQSVFGLHSRYSVFLMFNHMLWSSNHCLHIFKCFASEEDVIGIMEWPWMRLLQDLSDYVHTQDKQERWEERALVDTHGNWEGQRCSDRAADGAGDTGVGGLDLSPVGFKKPKAHARWGCGAWGLSKAFSGSRNAMCTAFSSHGASSGSGAARRHGLHQWCCILGWSCIGSVKWRLKPAFDNSREDLYCMV